MKRFFLVLISLLIVYVVVRSVEVGYWPMLLANSVEPILDLSVVSKTGTASQLQYSFTLALPSESIMLVAWLFGIALIAFAITTRRD